MEFLYYYVKSNAEVVRLIAKNKTEHDGKIIYQSFYAPTKPKGWKYLFESIDDIDFSNMLTHYGMRCESLREFIARNYLMPRNICFMSDNFNEVLAFKTMYEI